VHCLAVGDYAERLALAAGLEENIAYRVAEIGRLHDLGKLLVPTRLLASHCILTREDVHVMRDHAAAGAQLVAKEPSIAHLAPAVRAHHERLDGHGYPDGLRGEGIPLEARIVSVVDAFDALTRGRPYHRAESIGTALAILHAARGRQWQADLVDLFISIIEHHGVRTAS
jgi:putative two-component system response regulator